MRRTLKRFLNWARALCDRGTFFASGRTLKPCSSRRRAASTVVSPSGPVPSSRYTSSRGRLARRRIVSGVLVAGFAIHGSCLLGACVDALLESPRPGFRPRRCRQDINIGMASLAQPTPVLGSLSRLGQGYLAVPSRSSQGAWETLPREESPGAQRQLRLPAEVFPLADEKGSEAVARDLAVCERQEGERSPGVVPDQGPRRETGEVVRLLEGQVPSLRGHCDELAEDGPESVEVARLEDGVDLLHALRECLPHVAGHACRSARSHISLPGGAVRPYQPLRDTASHDPGRRSPRLGPASVPRGRSGRDGSPPRLPG